MYKRLFIFLALNFAALGIGGIFTNEGVSSDWYLQLNKAPWTPPGWMFGFAWTTIMLSFAVYLMFAWESSVSKKILIGLFAFQWLLNIIWNPAFFYFQDPFIGLIIISALTIVIGIFLFAFIPKLKAKVLFVSPYFIWLLIATSLNAYIFLNN